MRSRFLRTAGMLACSLALAACGGERRGDAQLPGGLDESRAVRQSELQPGAPLPARTVRSPYADDDRALAEGQRLYHWYNCSGCHFAGGGGIGPPLMDDDWIYGHEPENLLATILEGRPDGMPSFRGKITLDDAWKIVAYVESLGGIPEEGEAEPATPAGGERGEEQGGAESGSEDAADGEGAER